MTNQSPSVLAMAEEAKRLESTLREWATLQESDGSPWAEGYDAARRWVAIQLGSGEKS